MFNIKGGQSEHAKTVARAMGKVMGTNGLAAQTLPSQNDPTRIKNYAGTSMKESDPRDAITIKSTRAVNDVEETVQKKEAVKVEEKKKDDEDSDFDDDFGGDSVMEAIRAKRFREMQTQNQKLTEYRLLGHGAYTHVVQDEFLPAVTKSPLAICHFYHMDFERCKIVDKHLQLLAQKHLSTKFIYIDAEKTPFFVEKMKIKMLPTIVLFRDGIAIDRVVGFEELGNDDAFPTAVLEKRMKKVLPDLVDTEEDENSSRVNNIRMSSRSLVHDNDGVNDLLQ